MRGAGHNLTHQIDITFRNLKENKLNCFIVFVIILDFLILRRLLLLLLHGEIRRRLERSWDQNRDQRNRKKKFVETKDGFEKIKMNRGILKLDWKMRWVIGCGNNSLSVAFPSLLSSSLCFKEDGKIGQTRSNPRFSAFGTTCNHFL